MNCGLQNKPQLKDALIKTGIFPRENIPVLQKIKPRLHYREEDIHIYGKL